MSALERLRGRLAELADLAALARLGEWDQLVMMPAEGAAERGMQLGTLTRMAHERATAAEIGEWLAELEGEGLGEIDADVVRLARRDWERARRVPAELAAELSVAHAEGQESWRAARASDDFAAFVPALTRNLELARSYGQCVTNGDGGVYEALVSDFDFGLRTAEIERVFSALAPRLSELAGRVPAVAAPAQPSVPVSIQEGAVRRTLSRLGVEPASWRLDVSAHPFSTWMARRDSRITTRYEDAGLEAILSSLHEYGHALYERQLDPRLDRTNLAAGTSMSLHESQSKLWENHVARHPRFAGVLAEDLAAAGHRIEPEALHATLVAVAPSLIRVSADPVTYPLHIVLRFELELALVEGDLAVVDLPAAWREGMQRLLGLEVPSDALGCLQDIHWGAGAFGYFPSYAIGCLIAASLWETIEAQLGSRDELLARGEVASIREWLAEHVHRYGRRLDTIPLLESATGEGLRIEPFVRYASGLLAA